MCWCWYWCWCILISKMIVPMSPGQCYYLSSSIIFNFHAFSDGVGVPILGHFNEWFEWKQTGASYALTISFEIKCNLINLGGNIFQTLNTELKQTAYIFRRCISFITNGIFEFNHFIKSKSRNGTRQFVRCMRVCAKEEWNVEGGVESDASACDSQKQMQWCGWEFMYGNDYTTQMFRLQYYLLIDRFLPLEILCAPVSCHKCCASNTWWVECLIIAQTWSNETGYDIRANLLICTSIDVMF